MNRYEVIESRCWKRDDGLTASLYGSLPWTCENEAYRWKIETTGWTIRDCVSSIVGIGGKRFETEILANEFLKTLDNPTIN